MKQIIVLDTNPSEGGLVTIRAVFWLPVASGSEIPQPGLAGSVWKGASAAEIVALQVGTFVEEVRSFLFPNAAGYTTADMQKFLFLVYTSRSNYILAQPARGQYYGAFLDNNVWNAAVKP